MCLFVHMLFIYLQSPRMLTFYLSRPILIGNKYSILALHEIRNKDVFILLHIIVENTASRLA